MSGPIEDGAKLFACVEGRKLHGAKVTEYSKNCMGFHQLTLVSKVRRYKFFEFIHEIRYLLDILHTHTLQ